MCMIVSVHAPDSVKEAEEYHKFMVEHRMILNEGQQVGAERFHKCW